MTPSCLLGLHGGTRRLAVAPGVGRWGGDGSDDRYGLILDLVEWVGRKERAYQETMDAWRTSCPRLPVWEDATDRGLVTTFSLNGRLLVRATSAGLAFLEEKRPLAYDELRQRSGL